MDEQELCRKRLLDLSRQADRKGIVLFSDFLNLNEQHIFHSLHRELYTTAELYGGYAQAERQMAAFIPDALCYEWNYPLVCVRATPLYPKYAENLTHRDVLGGIDASWTGSFPPWRYCIAGKWDLYFLYGNDCRVCYGAADTNKTHDDPDRTYGCKDAQRYLAV